jgi:hypothetical protein
MLVVTRNRDLNSKKKWEVRKAHQLPSAGRAVAEVVAKGVTFCPSRFAEEGFGHKTVAICYEALSDLEIRLPAGSVPLSFSHTGKFILPRGGEPLQCADAVYFLADGRILALIDGGSVSESRFERASA